MVEVKHPEASRMRTSQSNFVVVVVVVVVHFCSPEPANTRPAFGGKSTSQEERKRSKKLFQAGPGRLGMDGWGVALRLQTRCRELEDESRELLGSGGSAAQKMARRT